MFKQEEEALLEAYKRVYIKEDDDAESKDSDDKDDKEDKEEKSEDTDKDTSDDSDKDSNDSKDDKSENPFKKDDDKEDDSEKSDDSEDDSKESDDSEGGSDDDSEDSEKSEDDSYNPFGPDGNNDSGDKSVQNKVEGLKKQYNDIIAKAFADYAQECIDSALEGANGGFGENIESILDNAMQSLKGKILVDLGMQKDQATMSTSMAITPVDGGSEDMENPEHEAEETPGEEAEEQSTGIEDEDPSAGISPINSMGSEGGMGMGTASPTVIKFGEGKENKRAKFLEMIKAKKAKKSKKSKKPGDDFMYSDKDSSKEDDARLEDR